MSKNVQFTNNSIQVKEAIRQASIAFLEEACGEVESQTKRNCAVVTGKTKGSFQHVVDEGNLEGHIGSNYDNAIWEEMGTGVYAVEGNGRKTPWYWTDEDGVTHKTIGKRPKRMLFNAFNSLKSAIISMAKERFGGIG